jgi:hypothetical protein
VRSSGSGRAVATAGGAGFGDADFREEREAGFESGPDPGGDVFAGGIVEARDVVEIPVIELIPDGTERGGDIGVIDEPAQLWIARTGDDDVDLETMAVESATFMGFGQARQEMRGFELESFAKFDVHDS